MPPQHGRPDGGGVQAVHGPAGTSPAPPAALPPGGLTRTFAAELSPNPRAGDASPSPAAPADASALVPVHGKPRRRSPSPSPDIQLFVAGPTSPDAPSPIKALATDRVRDVKFKVQARRGWFTARQRLILGGRELADDEQALEDVARLATNNLDPAVPVDLSRHIHLVVRLSDVLSLRVQSALFATPANLLLRPDETVADAKAALTLHSGAPAAGDQALVLDGRHLEDAAQLAGLGVTSGSVLHMVVKRSAKVWLAKVKHFLDATAKEFEVHITAHDTPATVKAKLPGLAAADHADHALWYRGAPLPDADASLPDLAAAAGGRLSLELVPAPSRGPGGRPARPPAADDALTRVFLKVRAARGRPKPKRPEGPHAVD